MECFRSLYIRQNTTFREALGPGGMPKNPPYLSIDDIFASHLERQRTLPRRIGSAKSYVKQTLGELAARLGNERALELARSGTLPREPALAFSYFTVSLTETLNAPEQLATYISTLRSAIGCCDDLLDKDRFYLVYGQNLFFLSHLMLDIGELALEKILPSKKRCKSIAQFNREMVYALQEGEEGGDIFRSSYPQGSTFARIAGLFSTADKGFKKQVTSASGYYDFGAHMLGEILDFVTGEKNLLEKNGLDLRKASEKAVSAFERAARTCPPSELRDCIQLEGGLIAELLSLPEELEKLASSKQKSKKETPVTYLQRHAPHLQS